MKVKAIVAGLALALGATSAQAQIVQSPNLGVSPPSELMLSVYDGTRTFVADLGSSFEDIRTMSSGLLTWDLGGLYGSNFSLVNLASSTLKYNVVAYSRQGATTNTANFGFMTTTNQTDVSEADPNPTDGVFTGLDALASAKFLSTLNGGSGPIAWTNNRFGALNGAAGADASNPAINSSYTTTNAADALWHAGSNWGNNIGGKIAGLDNEGTVGSDLAFWFFGAKLGTASTSDADAMKLFGNFHLASNGVLTYGSAPATVPVPGAVWLLGSALLGFIGLGSRKNKLAA
jgi:hypothetical protein